ncbi:MAG TPA: hemolysin family protein [Polyangiaceae bacterium LLY-WYZ-15_(1-7)]|nr:hypothetical protein [Myxococcales bacterium]MAT26456.1 hypothetical protein [Sandaracinus sp.]HJL03662.1 hemolysin family protein [Polyangiaceae bacterium LLY-WYZ-15_(1-7)]MBJ75006.1 hypothetical protein [Sandaracinus sp.]HJL07793.1 hemolysin family protein [Polyangiaceae bacterium LLY-WYZ-15_(1-7)]
MEEPSTQLALGIAGSLLLAALYSAANAGLGALGESALLAIRDRGGPYARDADRAIEYRAAIRTRLLIGRVVSVSLAAVCAAFLFAPSGLGATLGAGVAVAFTYGIASQVGGTIARRRAPRGALRTLRWMRPLELLMDPLAAPLTLLAKAIERVVPIPEEGHDLPARALEHLIEQGEEAGAFGEDHADLLRSVLEFEGTVAREVMVPRTKVVAFDIETSLDEVIARIDETGHSRYPVYRGSIDQVEGILYAKDLFRVLREGGLESTTLDAIIRRPAFFVQETQKIGQVLREMQARRFHMAVVADEFGGAAGVVTLEDILEEIVGEIEDEHDDETRPVQQHGPGRYVAEATVSVYDLEDILGETLAAGDGDYDSLGGMVVQLVGRVPEVGAELQVGAFDLRILEADDRHVTRVEIIRRPPSTTAVDAAQ